MALHSLRGKEKHKGQTIKSRIKSKSWSENFTKNEREFLSVRFNNYDKLIPSLENKFTRITLVHKERIERLTFDLNLSYQNNGNKIDVDNLVICELKQEKINRLNTFYHEMRKKLVRPMKVSKYCLGMMKYYSDREIKSNRFKKEDHTTKEDIMLINVILKKKLDEPFTLQWFDEDFYLLIMRLAINMVFITILIRFLYYEKPREKIISLPII